MTGQSIGYIRVSSEGQNTVRQLEGVEIDKEFIDTMTGDTKNRPQLEECLNYLRKGDTLHVHSIDRLARNLRDLQEIIEGLVVKDVSVKFHSENLTFTGDDNPMATLTLQMMGAFAEFERTMIRSRQREGIDAAQKEGKHLGRPRLEKPLIRVATELKTEGLSVAEIAKEMNLSRPSIYKLLSKAK
jgi:DNA invertase Pin-like site-specific DNA recombinase